MFLALAHMVGATQVMGWGGVGVGWGGDGNVHWTCTHGRCYTTACSLHLHTWSVLRKSWDGVGLGWCGVGMVMFIELAQKVSCTCLRDFLPEWFWSLCEFARACWRWIVCEYMTRCPEKTETAKNRHKRLDCQTLQFFSCSNSLRLPVNYDTTSKNTVAHSTFEHLEHHNISKIVILPHKSHVSHKYKCMNDGFFINQHADQKNFVRAEHNSM